MSGKVLKSFSAVAIVLVVLKSVSAQIPFVSTCPPVAEVSDLCHQKVMGRWFEYAKYPFVMEIGKKCIAFNYSDNGNGSILLQSSHESRITGRRSKTEKVTEQFEIPLLGSPDLGVNYTFLLFGHRQMIQVVATDYDSYLIAYSCVNLSAVAHTKLIWVMTRDHHPSTETVHAAMGVLDANKISRNFLIKTDHTGCRHEDDEQPITPIDNDIGNDNDKDGSGAENDDDKAVKHELEGEQALGGQHQNQDDGGVSTQATPISTTESIEDNEVLEIA